MKFEEEYAGKKISIDDGMNGHGHHPDHVFLSIDGIEVHVMKDRYGKYSSHFLPYQEFSTPLKLARALIDKVPFFKVKRSN